MQSCLPALSVAPRFAAAGFAFVLPLLASDALAQRTRPVGPVGNTGGPGPLGVIIALAAVAFMGWVTIAMLGVVFSREPSVTPLARLASLASAAAPGGVLVALLQFGNFESVFTAIYWAAGITFGLMALAALPELMRKR